MGHEEVGRHTCWEECGRAARSKHSDTWRRSLLASSMLLKKMVCSPTPSMPNVLLMEPTAAQVTCRNVLQSNHSGSPSPGVDWRPIYSVT